MSPSLYHGGTPLIYDVEKITETDQEIVKKKNFGKWDLNNKIDVDVFWFVLKTFKFLTLQKSDVFNLFKN